jgi:hypothetical protein
MTSNLKKIANAFNQECFEPKLSQYPNWFRQFINDPLQGLSYGLVGMLHQREMRDPPQEVFMNMRLDLFNLTLDVVRMRFRLWDMQKRMDSLQEQIDELKNRDL